MIDTSQREVKKDPPALYFDEDVSNLVIKIVRSHGFDVVSTVEANHLSINDEAQLQYALTNGRTFVTHNLKHFMALHKMYCHENRKHCGIIFVHRRRDNYEVARRLLRLLGIITKDQMVRQIQYV